MEIQYITAKLAKEKGFDEICLFGYTYQTNKLIKMINKNSEDILISSPTQCELQTWLRNKHNIIVYIDFKQGEYPYYHIITKDDEIVSNVFDNWEDALEMGLRCGISLI